MPFKKIKDKGGLRVHIEELGYSWNLFVILTRANAPNTVIAAVLGLDKPTKPDSRAVKHWRQEYRAEQRADQAIADKAVESLKDT